MASCLPTAGSPGVKGEKGDKGVGEMGDSGSPGAPGKYLSICNLRVAIVKWYLVLHL